MMHHWINFGLLARGDLLQALKAYLAAVIGVALALPVSAQTPAVLTASGAASQKPNIVIILADDFEWGGLGCYGAPEQLRTPHLDRLAREGRRFTDVYNAGSVCSPSRYALMTAIVR